MGINENNYDFSHRIPDTHHRASDFKSEKGNKRKNKILQAQMLISH